MLPCEFFGYRRTYYLMTNYVKLVSGVPTRMHFSDDYIVERDIQDPETGRIKRIRGLVLWVDRLGAKDCGKSFSVLSEKLRTQLEPFLKDKLYQKYEFIITEMGAGFYKDWTVEPILISET